MSVNEKGPSDAEISGFPEHYTGPLTPELLTPQTVADLELLMQLFPEDENRQPVTAEQLQPYIERPTQALMVAIRQGRVIGTISAAEFGDLEQTNIFTGSLVVLPEWRGPRPEEGDRTIYQSMFEHLKDYARSRGAAHLVCTIDPDNEASKKSHIKEGYTPAGLHFWEKKDLPHADGQMPTTDAIAFNDYPENYTGPVMQVTPQLLEDISNLTGNNVSADELQSFVDTPTRQQIIAVRNSQLVGTASATVGAELFAGPYIFGSTLAIKGEMATAQGMCREIMRTVESFAATHGANKVFSVVAPSNIVTQERLGVMGLNNTDADLWQYVLTDGGPSPATHLAQ